MGILKNLKNDMINKHINNAQRQKHIERELNRLITLREAAKLLEQEEQETKRRYDTRYAKLLINALNAPPYNFGKKRIHGLLSAFFGQVDGLCAKAIDENDLDHTLDKLGVKLEHKDGYFIVSIGEQK